jgi:hypothetical protein
MGVINGKVWALLICVLHGLSGAQAPAASVSQRRLKKVNRFVIAASAEDKAKLARWRKQCRQTIEFKKILDFVQQQEFAKKEKPQHKKEEVAQGLGQQVPTLAQNYGFQSLSSSYNENMSEDPEEGCSVLAASTKGTMPSMLVAATTNLHANQGMMNPQPQKKVPWVCLAAYLPKSEK